MGVGRAVGRAKEDSSAFICRSERTAFTRLEGVAGETLGEHAKEADERALRIIAAERIQRVACSVKRIDSVGTGPEGIATAGAQHPHAQTAMLFLIVGNPAFFGTAGRKHAAGDGIANDNVPIICISRIDTVSIDIVTGSSVPNLNASIHPC